MKQSALEEFTKLKRLYGQNQQQILDKFIKYADLCSDPMNVYKYMQQKSICIYLANYWTSRAILFAQMGDFKDSLLCLKEATSRNHIVSQHEVKIEDFFQKVKRKMVIAMKRLPPKGKRTANQYNFLYEKQGKITAQNLEKLVQIFQKSYKQAKISIEKQFSLKMHGKNKSWMSEIYQQNDLHIRKLSQKLKSLNNYEPFLSMRTPISKKDPMRLTKTMDSIQMLKKKKSTQPKQKKRQKFGDLNHDMDDQNQNKLYQNQNKQSDSQSEGNSSDQDDQSTPICINTTPLCRQLSMLSRRVTFNTKTKKFDKIQKIRSELQDDNKQSHSIEKAENIEEHAERSKSISKRGSILKNKKIQKEHQDMQKQS